MVYSECIVDLERGAGGVNWVLPLDIEQRIGGRLQGRLDIFFAWYDVSHTSLVGWILSSIYLIQYTPHHSFGLSTLVTLLSAFIWSRKKSQQLFTSDGNIVAWNQESGQELENSSPHQALGRFIQL